MLAVVLFCFTVCLFVGRSDRLGLVPPFPDLVINAFLALGYGAGEQLGNIVNAHESRRIIWSVVHLGG